MVSGISFLKGFAVAAEARARAAGYRYRPLESRLATADTMRQSSQNSDAWCSDPARKYWFALQPRR
jgi:hypothetical protein